MTAATTIHVVQGKCAISDRPGTVLTTILGSCVSVCIYDPAGGLGGGCVGRMNHFLLSGAEGRPQDTRHTAGEITAAARDVSARAETQAATLEQSAAAQNQLTESARSTAEGARAAEAASRDNHAIADKGASVVVEAVEAMKRIGQSSTQISRIIGVIDDIAFQTNLLALNAGGEVVRDAEAGRGFAVVASEVRAPAKRSAEAVRTIQGLINRSGEQTAQAVNLVGAPHVALGKIVEGSGEINMTVIESAASARGPGAVDPGNQHRDPLSRRDDPTERRHYQYHHQFPHRRSPGPDRPCPAVLGPGR
ncbi:methyl-accepting chemotaxis protein [Pseudogemmobacter sonorensis]|uniref:methyl-accepting chemotaxis protein n=1 Tax=Pseudogemmobacter sonorensis TaxID=2989681 RepID=UPI00368E42F0